VVELLVDEKKNEARWSRHVEYRGFFRHRGLLAYQIFLIKRHSPLSFEFSARPCSLCFYTSVLFYFLSVVLSLLKMLFLLSVTKYHWYSGV
jgi:hypothetical protein